MSLVVGGIVSLVALAGAARDVGPAVSGSDWPAWVQAVGSVLAIMVAVAVPWGQGRRAREESAADRRRGELDEIALRARFLNMASLQLDRAIAAAERISVDEQRFVHNRTDAPVLSWRGWASAHAETFRIEVVERLEKLEAMPLTAWPDVESGIMFGDGVRKLRVVTEDVRARLAEPDVPREKEFIHYTGSINLISEWSALGVYDFADFIRVRNHAVAEATRLRLDVRYFDRDAVDRVMMAQEDERRSGLVVGDRKTEFHSEMAALVELRASIKPMVRAELFRSHV